MCVKLEGKGVEGTHPCKYDSDCQPGCPPNTHGCCIHGRCWCFNSPIFADKIPGLIPQGNCFIR